MASDSWRGLIFDPITLHQYIYANSEPVSRYDPTGHETLPAALTSLAGRVALYLASIPAMLQQAFRQGGPIIGRLFQSMGTRAETFGTYVVNYYRALNPSLTVFEQQVVPGGTRRIDFFLVRGLQAAWLEVKYGLPWKKGEALLRLVDQAKQALATGKGEFVLWCLRPPSAEQLALLRRALRDDATRVRVISGVHQLWFWMVEFFGPVA